MPPDAAFYYNGFHVFRLTSFACIIRGFDLEISCNTKVL
jgi:hypothetical protein